MAMEKDEDCELARNVKPEKVRKAQGESSILHTIKRRNVNWIGHNLRRHYLLKKLLKER